MAEKIFWEGELTQTNSKYTCTKKWTTYWKIKCRFVKIIILSKVYTASCKLFYQCSLHQILTLLGNNAKYKIDLFMEWLSNNVNSV